MSPTRSDAPPAWACASTIGAHLSLRLSSDEFTSSDDRIVALRRGEIFAAHFKQDMSVDAMEEFGAWQRGLLGPDDPLISFSLNPRRPATAQRSRQRDEPLHQGVRRPHPCIRHGDRRRRIRRVRRPRDGVHILSGQPRALPAQGIRDDRGRREVARATHQRSRPPPARGRLAATVGRHGHLRPPQLTAQAMTGAWTRRRR